MARAKETSIELVPLRPQSMLVTIAGDGDLILNKMNNRNRRILTDIRKDKAKDTMEEKNVWEDIISAIHWRDGETSDYSEKGLCESLKKNAPCITAFGLLRSFMDTVYRNGIDKGGTRFKEGVNIVAKSGLVPISFAEHNVDEKLMSPKRSSPVLVYLNRFSGWKATFEIRYTGTIFSAEQIVNIINLAGFGNGIGSGRTSGFGRYHVESVESV